MAAPVLTVLKNGETIKSCSLEGEAVLGRSEDCVIRLEDRAISRQHVVFKTTPDGVQIEKKSEFAPLIINGKDCTHAILKEGDVILVGPYQLKITAPEKGIEKFPAYANSSMQSSAQSVPSPFDLSTVPITPFENASEGGLAPDPFGEAPVPPLGGAAPEAPLASSSPGSLMVDLAALQPAGVAAAAAAPGTLNIAHSPSDPHPAAQSAAGVLASPPVADVLSGGDALQPPAAGAPLESTAQRIQAAEPIDEEGKTRVVSSSQVAVKLILPAGAANVEEYDLQKEEICIGRGKNCDVVLNDKKSSRKNTLIRRQGVRFIIKDLDSANGTYVNGARITEQELTGDDRVRVGDVEFIFRATNLDYLAKEKDFIPVMEEAQEPADAGPVYFDYSGQDPNQPALPEVVSSSSGVPGVVPGAPEAQMLVDPSASGGAGVHPLGLGASSGAGISGGIGSIAGLGGGSQRKGNQSLLEKFKDLPWTKKVIIVGLIIWLPLALMDDPEEVKPTKKTPTTKHTIQPSVAKTYDQLTPEQQKFVDSEIKLANEFYAKKDYDQALVETEKVLQLVPGYSLAEEIKRFALQGQKMLRSQEEEKRKKEEEARLKAEIASSLEEVSAAMRQKQYEKAKELFVKVLSMDPENKQVVEWRREIERIEEEIRQKEQEQSVRVRTNQIAWESYQEGMSLLKRRKYYDAMEVFERILITLPSDKHVLSKAKRGIAQAKNAISSVRDPLLNEAKQFEDAGDFFKAYETYRKATDVDPHHREGHIGMNRIRGILHERGRALYSEAVLLESFSDLASAQKKFHEILETVPKGDLYYERAQRKLARFIKKGELNSSVGGTP